MLRSKEKPLPAEQNPVEPEKIPEYSGETLKMIKQIDNSIEYGEGLSISLDRLAKERIIKDSEGLEEIYAPKQIGKLSLEKYDANIFETASKGLWIKNLIYGSKNALKGEEGLVDTRKLIEEAKGKKYDLTADELKRLKKGAKKFGLNPEEINPQDFKMTFIESKKGAATEKVILQKRTEEEMIKTAGEIMERRLKELEKGQSAKLIIESKEGLAELIKEKEKLDEEGQLDELNEADLAKIENEEIAMKELIKQNQKKLDSELNIFREPLLKHQEKLAGALYGFSFLLEEITDQEKTYKREISGLETKINKFKGSKRIGELLKDEIKDWEEQKAQTEANLKDFREKKEALSLRITELKNSQTEVDAALARINNIGKTKAEQAEAEKQKRDELSRQRQAEREQRRREREQQRPEDIVRRLNRLDADETNKEDEQPAGQNISGQSAQASAPAAKSQDKVPAAKKSAEPKIENNPLANFAETEQENVENVVKKVSRWLDLLGLNKAPETAETHIENNFKIGKSFNLTSSMTFGQAKQSYTQYLIDFLKIPAVRAQRQANDKFEQIIENL